MITAIVATPASEDTGADNAGEMFENQSGNYRGWPRLFRKYNLYGEIEVGGVCVWGSREIAEATCIVECRASVAERCSAVARFFFFDTRVIVGNA